MEHRGHGNPSPALHLDVCLVLKICESKRATALSLRLGLPRPVSIVISLRGSSNANNCTTSLSGLSFRFFFFVCLISSSTSSSSSSSSSSTISLSTSSSSSVLAGDAPPSSIDSSCCSPAFSTGTHTPRTPSQSHPFLCLPEGLAYVPSGNNLGAVTGFTHPSELVRFLTFSSEYIPSAFFVLKEEDLRRLLLCWPPPFIIMPSSSSL